MIEIVETTPAHARRLVLRDGDAAEIAAFGLTPEQALRRSLERAVWAETYLIDGEPAAIVGLGLSSFVGGHGVPWLLTGPACERHKKRFLIESQRQVRRMLDQVSPLINYVAADYVRALRWLSWLGFTLDAPAPLNGFPFRRIHKER